MKFADFTNGLKGQKMFQILSKAKELEKSGKNVIHLEIGDPDFNSPEIAKESIKDPLIIILRIMFRVQGYQS